MCVASYVGAEAVGAAGDAESKEDEERARATRVHEAVLRVTHDWAWPAGPTVLAAAGSSETATRDGTSEGAHAGYTTSTPSWEVTRALLARDTRNSFGVMAPFSPGGERAVRGYAVYGAASLANHCCYPNACSCDPLSLLRPFALLHSLSNSWLSKKATSDPPLPLVPALWPPFSPWCSLASLLSLVLSASLLSLVLSASLLSLVLSASLLSLVLSASLLSLVLSASLLSLVLSASLLSLVLSASLLSLVLSASLLSLVLSASLLSLVLSASLLSLVLSASLAPQQGEEVVVSYFPLGWRLGERSARVKEEYGFECGCERCELERRMGGDESEEEDEEGGEEEGEEGEEGEEAEEEGEEGGAGSDGEEEEKEEPDEVDGGEEEGGGGERSKGKETIGSVAGKGVADRKGKGKAAGEEDADEADGAADGDDSDEDGDGQTADVSDAELAHALFFMKHLCAVEGCGGTMAAKPGRWMGGGGGGRGGGGEGAGQYEVADDMECNMCGALQSRRELLNDLCS
ncbi:unnamed protein product [Closterium sp. Naga37s-1]|nr:unnamed protein product [Closterium sp. Naga37s-1]